MYRRLGPVLNKFSKRRIVQAPQKCVYLPETIVTTLPNGFRVATENTGGTTATIGVWIDAGSRYENEKNNGAAHFLEHMAFKGTPNRTRSGLELEVENIGSHLNAYTSREHTTYYAKCFSEKLDQSVDILSDILLNSNLSHKDIESERSVILREMEEVEQNLQEVVFDLLHLEAFKGNALSLTILGPVENINSLNQSQLRQYIDTHYRSGRMLLAASGGVDHDVVVRLAEKYFGGLPHGDSSAEFHPATYTPCEVRRPVEGMDLCYGALVAEGTSWTHENSLPLMVVNTLLGEFDRCRVTAANSPSRLAEKVKDDVGVQSFQSFNTCYKETGLAGIYFVANGDSLSNLVDAVTSEWKWLATECDAASIERGKQNLTTNLLLMLDGSTPICEDIGRQLLCYGRRIPIPELKHRIESITVERVREVAKQVYLNAKVSATVVGDVNKWPSNAEIQEKLKR